MNSNLSLYQPSDESIVVYKSNDGVVQLDVQVAEEIDVETKNKG